MTVCSVVISFVIVVVLQFIIETNRFNISGWAFLLLSVACGLLSGAICARITDACLVRRFLSLLGKTPNSNIWKDTIDFDMGTTVVIFLKESGCCFTGVIETVEETDGDPWIILRDYTKDNSTPAKEPYLTRLALNLRDVEHMELYYQKDTTRLLK